ncbi:MAG TPA: response regulator transcription factor [Rubricoccaceae bacterium]|nr:response regulator transcription factor [Rubricoccaceae bacterium]
MTEPARRKVFLVDDSPLIVELLSDLVASQPDLSVSGTAQSGEEALRKIPASDCDLVLVDVSMPRMNGLELIGHLQRLRPDLPCLVVSAHSGESYVREAREAGAVGYVEKENPDALLEAIRALGPA